jgi:hypothetical protein
MGKIGSWLHKWWRGSEQRAEDTSHGPLDMFGMQALYDQYGPDIYARAAADPAFSAAISDLVAEIHKELKQDGPRTAKLLTNKTSLNYYLLGHTHALLAGLLQSALRPEAPRPAAGDPDFVAVHLGALFHLAFDGGLLRLSQGDAARH